MPLLNEIRARRLLPFMGAYLVTGFVVLEGVDQLISHAFLPSVAYPIALVFYLFGMLGSLTFAWYHGEKGRQETTRGEVFMHATLVVLALGTSAYVLVSQRRASELALAAASSGLEANSLAVLYFEDLSPGGDLAYVADGITEALIERLSLVRSLDVISKNGVEPFRGADIAVDSIARALEEKTGQALQIEEGSLYPALYRMTNRGWIDFEWGLSANNRKKKSYRLTSKGKKLLREKQAQWTEFTAAVALVLEEGTAS